MERLSRAGIEALVAQVILEISAVPNQAMGAGFDPDFRRRGMAEKPKRTRRASVGAGLEHADEIASLRARQARAARQNVERGAQRTHHVHGFLRRLTELVHKSQWIIAFDGLAQVPRCGEVMIHS